jgi:hypothetical protein
VAGCAGDGADAGCYRPLVILTMRRYRYSSRGAPGV